ncbi:MAG: DNA repair protein RecO C-terminal domain-containing protein [Bacteroidales bacterium]|nr:DNA repair protein RecO C-terminal domain-containing protein [Bacteroidales bacterium]MDY3912898.1 DNA repair protein RecO C-terminal domain-containing protein [Sodaliphilus sp.]
MRDKLHGIVLGTVRCTDRTSIVRIYTDRRGLMAFVSPQSATAAARMRQAMLMPLSLVEFEATGRPGSDLCRFHDLRRSYPVHDLYCDPVKNALAMFITEVLTHSIQEYEENAALYAYIATSVQLLECLRRGVANFHICFLYGLGRLMGIEPDTRGYRDGYWFDMAGGTFAHTPSAGGRWLPPAEARVAHRLSRMTFANMHRFRFGHADRAAVLEHIIAYYRMHNASLGTLKSLDVLKQVFSQ